MSTSTISNKANTKLQNNYRIDAHWLEKSSPKILLYIYLEYEVRKSYFPNMFHTFQKEGRMLRRMYKIIE